MKHRPFVSSLMTACLAVSSLAAHPGSGIVVDRQGQVYFTDTGHGVWKIGADGQLRSLGGPRFHWMAIDNEGRFSKTVLPTFPDAEITKVGTNPLLLLSSDFPLVIARDGALYYPELGRDERLQVIRFTSSGARTVLATLPAATESGPLRWLNGMAPGSDGSIYYSENHAVRKISPQGVISTVASQIVVPDCVRVPSYADDRLGPHLRGLDVAQDGAVFVTATACSTLVRITARGAVSYLLRATSPWSPTGIALAGNDGYILEYLHTAGEDRSAWLPRVRKLSGEGKVSIVATVERK